MTCKLLPGKKLSSNTRVSLSCHNDGTMILTIENDTAYFRSALSLPRSDAAKIVDLLSRGIVVAGGMVGETAALPDPVAHYEAMARESRGGWPAVNFINTAGEQR